MISALDIGILGLIILTAGPLWGFVIVGLGRIHRACRVKPHGDGLPQPPVDIIVPVKGGFSQHKQTLGSLLTQTYSDYEVIFILESLEDPANGVVDELCASSERARKIISGHRALCAQKNHNLVAGIKHVRLETKILVFCDSNNGMAPDWLERFTRPLREGAVEAVTTFRAFHPEPETLGGVCQAIYAAFVLLLALYKPKPWGGATGILRSTFERLNVAEAWSRTVVDDLILGNLLEEAGVKLYLDPSSLLISPVKNQTVQGFLTYLDRQILFPKWTNPGIWFQTLLAHMILTVTLIMTIVVALLHPFGYFSLLCAWAAYGFLGSFFVVAFLLHGVNPLRISLFRWYITVIPCILIVGFVFLRSIFRKYIDWHGTRYWPGKAGIVVRAEYLEPRL